MLQNFAKEKTRTWDLTISSCWRKRTILKFSFCHQQRFLKSILGIREWIFGSSLHRKAKAWSWLLFCNWGGKLSTHLVSSEPWAHCSQRLAARGICAPTTISLTTSDMKSLAAKLCGLQSTVSYARVEACPTLPVSIADMCNGCQRSCKRFSFCARLQQVADFSCIVGHSAVSSQFKGGVRASE